ncbi:MAG TPA: hypothetical protein VFX97_19065 [Pyrinomonadaceae bacterium]|nr:hypothetical protein [Pyrinomonadaceae bacterium]
MTRFSKVFQLLTVVLVIAIANVYVLGAPVRSTDPKKADAPETTATAEVPSAEIATTAAPVAVAAEKLPLAPNAKIDFNRIFAKSEIKARASATQTFFKANVSGRNTFKAPARTGTAPQDDPDTDSGGGGSKGTWIAVGVIAAVLTIAVIGLRKDRNREGVSPSQ